jgi:carboxyl-terminal processing protease
MKRNIRRKIISFSITAILSAITGIAIWSFAKPEPADDNLFEIRKNSEIFFDVYKYVDAMYVDNPEPGKLMKIGIDAMLESLDPYTNYIPESKMEDYRFMTTGQYGGIGALIKRWKDFTVISEPYEGFPAEKSGIRAGDILMSIDGKSIENMDSESVSNLLKGQPGEKVKLKLKRGSDIIEKDVVREEVKLPDVPYYGIIDNNIGYIKLNSFTQTAHRDVEAAFKELKTQDMKKLVLDLRGNGGGLLIESVKIVNMFVKKGEKVVEMRGRLKDLNRTYLATDEPLDTEIPIVVLVDEGSASASEIVSGALQDLDRAVVVGQNTYGKGLVQQTHDLKYNGKIKITIAKYYTPSGRCIQKLDYFHKNDQGVAGEVPDSLITYFKTKNGRQVSDGRGIEPDVNVELPQYSPVVAALMREDLIFNYATTFRAENDSVASPENFRLTENMFVDFKKFVLQASFEYKTASVEELKKWRTIAEKEKYFTLAEKEWQDLIKKVTPDAATDIENSKEQIRLMLENEIISRYYFQKGRYRASFHRDDDLLKAREILNNTAEYLKILKGSN